MAEAITIRTLAQIAGVSTATVSLALRNDPRISSEVRKRIQRIATEAGYRPNPIVANLIAQVRGSKGGSRHGTLGIVFASKNPSEAETPMVKKWIAACEARANQLGYGSDRFILDRKKRSPEHLAKIIDARGIRGLIAIARFPGGIIPPEFNPIWQKSATIVLGSRPIKPALSAVTHDHFFNAVLALREVTRLGYRRPGLCLHSEIDDVDESRCIGGFSAEQIALLPGNRIPVFCYKADAERSFRAWVTRHRPDVILTLHFEIRAWLEALGLSAPGEIGLVHLDRTLELGGWAGIEQRHEQISFGAVDMLTGQLSRYEFGPPPFQKCMFIYGTWKPGDTVREQSLDTNRSPRRKDRTRRS